jgi:hypothetical protein
MAAFFASEAIATGLVAILAMMLEGHPLSIFPLDPRLLRVMLTQFHTPAGDVIHVASNLLLSGVACRIAYRRASATPRDRLALRAVSWPTVVSAAAVYVAASTLIWGAANHFALTEASETFPAVYEELQRMSEDSLVLAIVLTGGMTSLAEELLFRGFMQTRLTSRWGSFRGVFVTSVLFGLAHLDWFRSPDAFAAGMILGWLVVRTGSLWSAVAAHAAGNTLSVFYAANFFDRECVGHWLVPLEVGALLASTVVLFRLTQQKVSLAPRSPPP